MSGLVSDNARKVFLLARQEAIGFKQDHIEPVHVLLGIIKQTDNGALRILKELNVDVDALLLDAEQIAQSGTNPSLAVPERPLLSRRVKKVVENSLEESHSFNNMLIKTEFLLLGLLREQDATTQLLTKWAIDLERKR